jgi:hypothetical protein
MSARHVAFLYNAVLMTVTSEKKTLKSIKKTFLLDVEYNFLKYDHVPYSYARNVYFIMAENLWVEN